MSKKIARITQDKKLLLANEVVEGNTKTSLNSDGRLDIDEIIEYPDVLEGGRNLLKQKSDGNYSNVHVDAIIQDGIIYWTQISKATAPFTFLLYDTTLKTDDFIFSFKTNQIQELRPFIHAYGKTLRCSPVIAEHEDYYHVSMAFQNVKISNSIYFYGTKPFEPPKEIQFWDFKLEKGSQATDWTPAPEDLGLNYSDNIQNFGLNVKDNNSLVTSELIEGYPFVKPVIDDSLVLWLDGSTGNNYEQTGTWKDLSGNGNDGELVNFAYTEDSGWGNGGLKFNGDTHVDCGDGESVNITDDLTLEMWVLIPSDGNLGGLVKGWEGGWINNSYGLRNMGEYYSFYISDGSSLRQLSIHTPKDRLVHVVGTTSIGGDFMKGYVDGELVNSDSRFIDKIHIQSGKLYVGVAYAGVKTDGTIYLARVYNRALTDEEILQNYQAGQCSPLLAMRGDVIG